LVAGLALVLGAVGCASHGSSVDPSVSAGQTSSGLVTIRVGTLQTDDILPLWAAAADGSATAAGLDLRIQSFLSAQDQVTAVTAGQLDAIMTDMVVPVQLSASGTAMRSVTRLQTSPAGIVVSAGSGIDSIADLAGVPTGCAAPTIMEFIYDKALTDAGVPADQIKTEEIKNLSVRLQMLTSGNIEAAMLPWTLFALAVQQGNKPLLDVAASGDYSSTVLAFRDQWLTSNAREPIDALLRLWDAEAAKIDADPAAYQTLLAEQAKLPAPLDTTYQVRQYPTHGLPDRTQFEAVVGWMVSKAYIQTAIPYADLVWSAR
jgi:NitT/TauT family transport system substrate-binding protein